MSEHAWFLAAAVKISNGEPVDWAVLENELSSSEDVDLLSQLKNLQASSTGAARCGSDSNAGIESELGAETLPLSAVGSSESQSSTDLGPFPRKWGQLELLAKLGQGAQGAVFRAQEMRLDRVVALKLAPISESDQGRDVPSRQAYEEAQLLARVRHPNVVTVHGVEVLDGWLGMWMELVRGTALGGYLEKVGTLGASEAALIATDICRALAAVHAEGLVHGDIKCDNIMREVGGRIVLMDFGLVQVQPLRVGEPAASVRGTPYYMAPELFRREKPTVVSDIYAIGVILYRLVSGHYPVEASSISGILQAHRTRQSTPLADIRPDLPTDFLRVIQRALALESTDRFSSVGELAEALGSTQKPVTVSERRPREGTHPHNLPREISTFVGRDHEIEELVELLRTEALVTLTGTGGCGKTRLALRAARSYMDEEPSEVWLVKLAPVTAGDSVPSSVATTLGVKGQEGRSLTESVISHFSNVNVLLVLDNCEHLLDSVVPFVDQLLRASPNLSVLATSREPLGITGESVYPVSPLPFPELGSVKDIQEFESVRLFLDRSRAVQRHFELTDQNATHIAQICRRLDGIPLAIELAAARVKILDVGQIAERLDNCFGILTSNDRTVLGRHRTLSALVNWSYELLPTPERLLVERLSIFSGGWSLEAAEQVCSEAGIEELDVLNLSSSLVDKSLVELSPGRVELSGRPRYRMLETVRQFAGERLAASGGLSNLQARHCNYFVELAKRLETESELVNADRYVLETRLEYENFQALIASSSVDTRNSEAALQIGVCLGRFWLDHGLWTEGRRALAGLIEMDEKKDTPVLARALRVFGELAAQQQDFSAAASALEQSRDMNSELGEPWQSAQAMRALAWVFYRQNDFDKACPQFEAALEVFRSRGDSRGITSCAYALANVARRLGRQEDARSYCKEALTRAREQRDYSSVSLVILTLAKMARESDEVADLAKLAELCLSESNETGDDPGIARALEVLSRMHVVEDPDRARSLLDRALILWRTLDRKHEVANILGILGASYIAENPLRAKTMLEESLKISNELRDQSGAARALSALGGLAFEQRDLVRSRELLEESLSIQRGIKERTPSLVNGLIGLLHVALSENDLPRATEMLTEALDMSIADRGAHGLRVVLRGAMKLAIARGNLMLACRLLSLFERERQPDFSELSAPEDTELTEQRNLLVSALGSKQFDSDSGSGRSLSLEEAAAEALEWVRTIQESS